MPNNKEKGNRVENEVAKMFTEHFEETFKRVPQSGAWSTNNKDTGARDDAIQVLSGDIMAPENFRFSIEVKSRVDFNFWDMLNDYQYCEIDEWLDQAEEDAERVGKEPLVFVKVNRRKPFVLIPKRIYHGKVTYGDYSVVRVDLLFENTKKELFYEL